jgi:alpha-tubulin suppressor-like RCC1 family protein
LNISYKFNKRRNVNKIGISSMAEDKNMDGSADEADEADAVHAATSPVSPGSSSSTGSIATATTAATTTRTNNPNSNRPEKKQYYAIGFGSNYFHPFGNSAISLNDIYAHVPATATTTASKTAKVSKSGMEGITTASSTDESINQKGSFDTNMIMNADMHDSNNNGNSNNNNGNNNQQQSFDFPSAFVFPLHPEQNSSTVNTNAAKQQTRSFLRFLRRKKKNKLHESTVPSSSSASKNNNDKAMQKALASIASSDKAFELPYAFHKRPAEQVAAGMTHVAFIGNNNDEASSTSNSNANSYKQPHGIYMTGTLHGVTYPHPTLKQAHAKIPLRCTQIACGRRHTLAVFEGKVTMSWGSGYFGQLGHGLDHVYCHQPTVIERLVPRYLGGEVVAIAAGGMQSAIIVAADNSTLNASSFMNRQNLKDVNTRVFRFGSNKHGQCAVEGGKCNSLPYPTIMMDVYHPDTGKRVSFVSLALGKLHSVGLTHHGELYSWGSTASGRCGHGDIGGSASTSTSAVRSTTKLRNGVSLPRRIEALRNVKVVDVSAGDAHTLALSGSGRVFSWGNNASGQLGVGHSMHLISPRLIADLEFAQNARGSAKGDLSEAASAESQSQSQSPSILHSSSRDQGQGQSSSDIGHLGATLAPIHYPSSPQKKASQKVGGWDPIPPRITSIHASGAYSAAVSTTGDIYSWGCGDGNQLGHSGPVNATDLPNAERLSVPRTNLGERRTRDVQSFDSKLNVLLPRRVDCLRHFGLKAESLVTSSNFMLAICSKLDIHKNSQEDEESYLMGRTLYELENDRRERGFDRIRLLRGGVQNQDTIDKD